MKKSAAIPVDRHFYSSKRAFGRFAMRIFEPMVMPQPHWHGHIEANLAIGCEMEYQVDGQIITVPANQLVIFWAGIPHQLTKITRAPDVDLPKLCNIYLPLDTFLMMNHIAPFQMSLLAGAMIALPQSLCDLGQVTRWYSDYRSGDFERADLVKMELNALFRRALLQDLHHLRPDLGQRDGDRVISSAHMRHVIAMVRHVLENFEKPLRNADITAVTGLHENYALSLFTQVMRTPLKQFLIRMRLMRARALLVESSVAIVSVAEASGFASVSQFYAQFKAGYGMPPAQMRDQYLRMELR